MSPRAPSTSQMFCKVRSTKFKMAVLYTANTMVQLVQVCTAVLSTQDLGKKIKETITEGSNFKAH